MKSPAKSDVHRWKCICAYDGTSFAGWQSQAHSAGAGDVPGAAIQDVIEARLAQIFKAPIRIHGSGRTDSGVHAHGQVFHFDGAWGHAPEKLLAAFPARPAATLQIKSIRAVAPGFHARFDATGKRYELPLHLGDANPFTRPFCWPFFRPLDWGAMQAAAAVLRGRHDFRAFTALNGPAREDHRPDLRRLELSRRVAADPHHGRSDGFLYRWCAASSACWSRSARESHRAAGPHHPPIARAHGRGADGAGAGAVPNQGFLLMRTPAPLLRRFARGLATSCFRRSVCIAARWSRRRARRSRRVFAICAAAVRRNWNSCGRRTARRAVILSSGHGGESRLPEMRGPRSGVRPGKDGGAVQGPARALVIELKYHRGLHVLDDMAEIFAARPT